MRNALWLAGGVQKHLQDGGRLSSVWAAGQGTRYEPHGAPPSSSQVPRGKGHTRAASSPSQSTACGFFPGTSHHCVAFALRGLRLSATSRFAGCFPTSACRFRPVGPLRMLQAGQGQGPLQARAAELLHACSVQIHPTYLLLLQVGSVQKQLAGSPMADCAAHASHHSGGELGRRLVRRSTPSLVTTTVCSN